MSLSEASAQKATVVIDLGLGDVVRAVSEAWRTSSADAKKAVPADELIREMNILIGQREAFLPRFEPFVLGRPTRSSDVESLRSEAQAMMATANKIDAMAKKLDPEFVNKHSEVHIEAVSVATERGQKSADTLRVLDGGGVDHSELLRRLRSGTCDLRRVVHDLRVANGQRAELSEKDKACGMK
jgi:hypothetical protein